MCLSVIVINAPWVLWFAGMPILDLQGAKNNNLFLEHISNYIFLISKHLFPPVLIVITLIILGYYLIKEKSFPVKSFDEIKPLILLLLFIVVTIGAFSLISSLYYFRYVSPLIPIFCMLLAMIITYSMKLHASIGIGIIAFIIIISPISDFHYEITHDYDGPIEGIVKYLNKNAGDDDIVLTEYGDLPIKFYTDLRVISFRTIKLFSAENLSSAYAADWIILRKYWFSPEAVDLLQHMPENKFKKIVIDYPDTPFENRECPELHNFKTVQDEDRVILYHKIK